ncbi:MAG: flagellar protein FlgN [Limnochordia bacterium]|jgi:flagellar biosynthesis/type III secretory pathway chaperone|nr:flagellar protein FlgN [Limnochordia bacterium]
MTVWDDFLAVVKSENEILRELVELSVAKQRQINNAQEVSRLAGEEQTRLTRLEAIDKERSELFDVLSVGKSLEEWLTSLDGEQQEEVAPLLLDLTENLGRLQSLNDLNQELLTQSLSYVQFSLNLLIGDDTSPTYTRPGANTAGKSIFDRKV